MPHDLEHLLIEPQIFGRPTAGQHQSIVHIWSHVIKCGVEPKAVPWLFAICLMPFEIVNGRGDKFARFLARTHRMNVVSDREQCLKRDHDFVVFHEVADDHQDFLGCHVPARFLPNWWKRILRAVRCAAQSRQGFTRE
jgi:hypothetical protein